MPVSGEQIWSHRLQNREPKPHMIDVRPNGVSCDCGWSRATITGTEANRYGQNHAHLNWPSFIKDHRLETGIAHSITVNNIGWSCICGESFVTVVKEQTMRSAYIHARTNDLAPIVDERTETKKVSTEQVISTIPENKE